MSSDQPEPASLETLGQVTRSAVHDLNNLMCTILMVAELMSETLPADHPLSADIREIQRAGQRALACAKELHKVGRQLTTPPQGVGRAA